MNLSDDDEFCPKSQHRAPTAFDTREVSKSPKLCNPILLVKCLLIIELLHNDELGKRFGLVDVLVWALVVNFLFTSAAIKSHGATHIFAKASVT